MSVIEVVAAIIYSDKRIFVTERGYGRYKGFWEFPGGKIEAGETHEAALRREIREELASEVKVGEKFVTTQWDYPEFRCILHLYWCTLSGPLPVLLEHQGARWLGPDELEQVRWLPADVALLPQLRDALNKRC